MRGAASGETLFRRGDPADYLSIVLDGELKVSVGESGDEQLDLAVIGPGGYVGEIALLDGGRRSATVTCSQPTELFVLSRQAFVHLLQANPELLSSVLANLTRAVRNSTEGVLEQQLRQRVLRADMELARHRALNEMVAGVAHELNTPLGVARTAASFIGSRVAAGALENVAEAAALIERNIERAHRLVEEFKTLSVSQVSDSRQEVDLVQVVAEIVELFTIGAHQSGLRIQVNDRLSATNCNTLWLGYRGRLSQVLLNLMSNVERYAYPDAAGGPVEIDIAPAQEDGFVVTVRDQGRGIASNDLPRVFEPFFTTGRARGGSGLGLAIVYNLVRDGLGGSVEIASQPGAGTTVTLRLPKVSPAAG